ncbi:MAG TPA: CopG family transcriptional regulator [Candidatus Bathyarchaeia archaeon]
MAEAEKVKVTVNLTKKDLDTLKAQATKEGITVTDALRRAIGVGRIAADAKEKGHKLLVEDEGGALRQIEIL